MGLDERVGMTVRATRTAVRVAPGVWLSPAHVAALEAGASGWRGEVTAHLATGTSIVVSAVEAGPDAKLDDPSSWPTPDELKEAAVTEAGRIAELLWGRP